MSDRFIPCPHCGHRCPPRVAIQAGVQLGACAKCRRVFRLFIDDRKVQYVLGWTFEPEAENFPDLIELWDDYPDEVDYLLTAYHEAGHAVAHYGFGARVDRVTVRRTPDRKKRLGYMSLERSVESEVALCQPFAKVIGLMAGATVASVAMNDYIMPVGTDAKSIDFNLSAALAFSMQVLRQARGETGPISWSSIPPEWTESYYDKIGMVTGRIFARRRKAWRAVKAIVIALLINPTIDSDEAFHKIIAPTGFKRGSLRGLLYSPDVQPDIPDPDGVLAKYGAHRLAEYNAWVRGIRGGRSAAQAHEANGGPT